VKEISLKKVVKKQETGVSLDKPRDSYPTFSIYEEAPEDIMKIPMGAEVTARIRKCSEDIHKGDNSRNSCGFEVLTVMVKDEEKIKKVMDDTGMPSGNRDNVITKYMVYNA
jgi:hypothetical protein